MIYNFSLMELIINFLKLMSKKNQLKLKEKNAMAIIREMLFKILCKCYK